MSAVRGRILFLALSVSGILASCGRTADGMAVLKANADYEAGRIHDAIASYMDVGTAAFDGAVACNLANAFSALGELRAAEPLYQEAGRSPDALVAAAAFHNLGVALYGLERYPEAARAFKSSLLARPGSLETMRAYELALDAARPDSTAGAVERGEADLSGTGGEPSFFSMARKQDQATYTVGESAALEGADH
ncbi:MAG: tetratricopeptide repeat protein [Spirochaetales bacterium]|nr:tetratricopeptide repeat protein [Spirochaetales bacterium]